MGVHHSSGGIRLKRSEIFNVFFREKPSMLLITLNASKTDIYASSVAKHIDCTYSHVVKILRQMEEADLITFQKQGRLKLLSLTKKGQEVAECIDKVRTLL